MLNLAVLISGNGSNLQALIDACADDAFPAQISVVISNRPDAYGLKRAENANIPTITVDHKGYKSRCEFDAALGDALDQYDLDLICLAGFMRILTADFINNRAQKIINTHPSLLPKFGGEGMHGMNVHKAVIEAGEKTSGCSIHAVIPAVDQGDVILQKPVDVLPDDTPESLAARVIEQEHLAYPEAVRMIAEGKA